MRGVVVEQSHVERTEDVDKDKKKKRRSNRRSKQNSFVSVSSSVNELHEEQSEIFRVAGTSNEQALPRASNVAFNSLPTMHIIEQGASHEDGRVHERQLVASGARMFSRSCPDTITGEESTESCATKYFLLYNQRKYFTPHWPPSAINDALEKAHLFKALFRVNAHNRLEAYCKIDGVHTDVLINGVAAQNRAIEGDIVVIKVDPLSSWAKMKGSSGNINSSAALDDYNSSTEVSEMVVGDGCKGKIKTDTLYECVDDRNYSLSPDRRIFNEGGSSFVATVGSELLGCFASGFDNCCSPASLELDPSQAGCSSVHNSVASPVEKLCAMLSTFPSKRPTGRVVSIIQMSPRRDAIVGFLNVKQYLSNREVCKKENKKKKNLCANQEYIVLTPTDPRLPKMMVLVTEMPDFIRKRLEEGDMTLEMELVAARIDHWEEENYVPQARVMHIFGRGGEIEPRVAAILFENAICSSDFSVESLSCLPCLPWEVPVQELKSRRDLRNLCIFTIDPSTATDLDDALSVERLSNGIFRVGVHIADVSYFVLPDTELDREAQIRSTSVYLLRSKIPMLPSLLSENLGSLNPGVDRLAISIFWDINLAGELLDWWIGRTVIRSCCKLSYENAQDIIDSLLDVGSSTTSGDGCPQLHGDFGWSDIVGSVQILNGISKILKEKRFNEGALRMESLKLVFLLDEDGAPYDSILSERKDANFLVEELMLLANTTAAEVTSRAYPDNALLRRHPEPNLRKLREFEAFCSKHGLKLDTSSSSRLHQSLEQIRKMLKNDTELFNILVSFASKPMQLATYFCSSNLSSENDWRHYALAVPVYTHFTSPLRRYADIVVHRKLAATVDAEEMYLKRIHASQKLNSVKELTTRCFTGICFDKDAAESIEGREALSVAASKHTPCTEVLADVADYSNERKLASRNVKDASDRLYMWFLLKKKEIILTEARVLGLGPRFMSIYVQKFAIERRIYYDEIEDLKVEWLDITSTLVLNLSTHKRFQRRGSPGKSSRAIEEVALVTSPLELAFGFPDSCAEGRVEVVVGETSGVASVDSKATISDGGEIEPAVFPLTVRPLSKVPVALHAIGGDDGALDIGARLYVSSYLMMMR